MSINTGAIYDQILALKIDLDFEDIPTPSYLQEKILECSDQMRAIEKRIIEVTREYSSKEKELKLEQMRLEVKRRNLLVNDPKIKKLPTGKEREAAADETLQGEHESILAIENDVVEMRNLLSSIRLVHQNIKTTNSDIRVLMRIMEQQVYKLNIGSREDKEMKELVAGLGEIEQLEDELTLDDVESSSESIDTDKPDSRSESTPQTQTDTVLDEASSESEGELDTISAFLTDDSEEIGDQTTASEDDESEDTEEERSAQSAVESGSAKTKNSAPESTEASGNGGGGSVVTDLDIDLGDVLVESPAAPVEVPATKKKAESSKVAKKEVAPVVASPSTSEKEKPKKGVEVELDIDDILTSLD